MPNTRPQSVSELVGEQVLRARKSKRWTQEQLAEKLVDLGLTAWRQSKVAKVEVGAVKKLSVEDAVALAFALDVQLAHLLAPDVVEDEKTGAVEDVVVAITPRRAVNPADFRAWLRGKSPLSQEAKRAYYTGAIVPESEIEGEYGAGGLTVYGAASLALTVDIETKGSKEAKGDAS